MNEWWDGLSLLLKVLYCIAFPSTLILLVQTLLSMFGFHDGGSGHDFSDTSGLDLDVDTNISGHGDANAAVKLIVADKLEELISIQVEAIKNIKIDKITVWDTGAGADGKGSTANFLSGLMQSVPPLNDLFKQAGMSLPDFLGEDIQEALKKSQEEAVKRAAEADNAETLDPKDVEVIEPEK